MSTLEAVKDKKGSLTRDQQQKVAKWVLFVDRDELRELLHLAAHHAVGTEVKKLYDESIAAQEEIEPEHPIVDELDDLEDEPEEATLLPADLEDEA